LLAIISAVAMKYSTFVVTALVSVQSVWGLMINTPYVVSLSGERWWLTLFLVRSTSVVQCRTFQFLCLVCVCGLCLIFLSRTDYAHMEWWSIPVFLVCPSWWVMLGSTFVCSCADTRLGGQASAAAVGLNYSCCSLNSLLFFACVKLKSWDSTSDTSLTWIVDIQAGTSLWVLSR